MAYPNKIIRNPKTGQDIRFLQTNRDTQGLLLEMESTYNAFSSEPPPHYHPNQEENFKVLAGELTVRIDGEVRVLKPGESLHIPRHTVHAMWNNTNIKTVVHWIVRPALDTEHLLETVAGLARDGKTNKDGSPGLLQAALLLLKYADVFRLAKPPFAVLRFVFIILTPFAYLWGYRPTYSKYLD